jgi:hypothetical protein
MNYMLSILFVKKKIFMHLNAEKNKLQRIKLYNEDMQTRIIILLQDNKKILITIFKKNHHVDNFILTEHFQQIYTVRKFV